MGAISKCQHCNNAPKTVDHLASKCDRMLSYEKEMHPSATSTVLRGMRSHSVQETVANENAEIRVDTRIKTDIKVPNNRPDLFILDKKRNEILLVEVGITNQETICRG